MGSLKPLPADYNPGYPRELTDEQIEQLLRPSILERFSAEALVAGALVVGMTASGCHRAGNAAGAARTSPGQPGVKPVVAAAAPQERAGEEAPAALPPPTKAAAGKAQQNSPRPKPAADDTSEAPLTTNPQVQRRVEKLVLEVLGNTQKGYWNDHTSIRLARDLKSNPPIKYPQIPISFGNSYVGIFDTAAARDATMKLFEIYGIRLEKDFAIKGEGYEFVADGYHPTDQVGFKIVMPEGQVGFGPTKLPAQTPEQQLDPDEKKALDAAIQSRELKMFVVDATGFPNMDGDLYTPMEYYLASVIDYLNWVHGDRQIDRTTVLGKAPARVRMKEMMQSYPTLPGCTFEQDADLAAWQVEGGKAELSEDWAGFGRRSLKLTLQPGGKAVYTVPAGETVTIKQNGAMLGGQLYHDLEGDQPVPVTFTLKGTNGKTWSVRQEIGPFSLNPVITVYQQQPPFETLESITITAEGTQPLALYVDTLGLTRDPPSGQEE